MDEIVKPSGYPTKWILQDTAIASREAGTVVGKPTYFKTTLALLKTIDFNKVDYITISGGANDFTARVLLNNELNKNDTDILGGSLSYSLEKIYTRHKEVNILVQTPIYRFWIDGGRAFIDDSKATEFNGNKLVDFADKIIEVAKKFNIHYSDNYREIGFNKFNRELYFPNNDGTCPNAEAIVATDGPKIKKGVLIFDELVLD